MRRSTVVAVLACVAIGGCDRAPTPPERLVPGLAEALPRLAEVRIEQDGVDLTVERHGEDWRIRDAEWRVDRRWLQPLLLSLANARCDEPRTADAARFERIGVAWPPAESGGDGAFARPTGRVVVAIGGREAAVVIGFPQARGGTFVRVEGAPHSCLTAATLRLPARPGEWFDPQLWRVSIDSITAVQVDDPEQAPIRLFPRDGRFVREGDLVALTPMPDALAAALASPRHIDRRAVEASSPAWRTPERVLRLEHRGDPLALALRRDGVQTWARVVEAPEAERTMFGRREFLLPADVAEPLWTSRAALGVD